MLPPLLLRQPEANLLAVDIEAVGLAFKLHVRWTNTMLFHRPIVALGDNRRDPEVDDVFDGFDFENPTLHVPNPTKKVTFCELLDFVERSEAVTVERMFQFLSQTNTED